MYFDISYKFVDFIEKYFFIIYLCLMDLGIDMIKELIFIVFVVYYMCGGVMVNL